MWTASKYWKSLFIFFIEKFAHEWLCLSRKLQDATDVNIADKMAACTGPYVCEAAGAGTQSRAEQLGELGLPGCDEALSGMGDASLTNEVPGVI